jgi:exodeoxyribonuclease VII small subunit
MKTFEEKLARLEAISTQLRQGTAELSLATDLFEEGISLAQELEKELNRVEQRVEVLVKKPTADGEKPVLELFPELEQLRKEHG